jgi:hypothetical protein
MRFVSINVFDLMMFSAWPVVSFLVVSLVGWFPIYFMATASTHFYDFITNCDHEGIKYEWIKAMYRKLIHVILKSAILHVPSSRHVATCRLVDFKININQYSVYFWYLFILVTSQFREEIPSLRRAPTQAGVTQGSLLRIILLIIYINYVSFINLITL